MAFLSPLRQRATARPSVRRRSGETTTRSPAERPERTSTRSPRGSPEGDEALGDAVGAKDEGARDARLGHDGRPRREECRHRGRQFDFGRHEESGLQEPARVRDERLDDERPGLGAERRADVGDPPLERTVRERLDREPDDLAHLDRADRGLGDRKLGAERLDLHEPRDRLAALDERSFRDLLFRHEAGEGRADDAVLEGFLRESQRRLREVEVDPLPLVLRLRDDLLLAELGVAGHLGLRPGEVRLRLLERGSSPRGRRARRGRRPCRRTSPSRRGRGRHGCPARTTRRRSRRRRGRR